MENKNMEKAIIGVCGDSNILNALMFHLPKNVQKQIATRRTMRRNGKIIEIWSQIDCQIREQKFPILYLCKPAPAVIISQEEYKRLKELEKDLGKVKSIMPLNVDAILSANEEKKYKNFVKKQAVAGQ